jgi:Flp pilus assembly protein TadG
MPRRGSRGDGGAAAVEFALLLPLFFMLVFGMISAGIALSRQISLTQAAREASRYGATLSFPGAGGGVDAWLGQVAAAVQQAAGDPPLGGYDPNSCVAHVDPTGVSWHRLVDDVGSVASGPCPGTALSGSLGSYVQVVLYRQTEFNAVLFSPTITLSSSSVTPFEGGL